MKLLRPLLLLLIVGGVAASAYFFWLKKKEPAASMSSQSSPEVLGATTNPFFSKLSTLKDLPKSVSLQKPDVQELTDKAKVEIAGIQEKGSELQKHIGVVLGTNDDGSGAAANNGTVQERALEYGQYLYCKGVVEEWEKK